MLLSILGSAAQEESLSISKKLKWSYRRRMKSGDFITCNAPLGYFLKNGTLIPDPQEVPIVEYIFRSYLAGKNMEEISDDLNRQETQFVKKRPQDGTVLQFDIFYPMRSTLETRCSKKHLRPMNCH